MTIFRLFLLSRKCLDFLIKNDQLYNYIFLNCDTAMKTSNRKAEHIRISLEKDVQFRTKTTGFEEYDFIHCALPEMDFQDIITETSFLGKILSYPLMISAMTGGYSGALNINEPLTEACEEEQIAMGVGSQRQLLENNDYIQSYRIMRKKAPSAVIIGNIGGIQLTEEITFSQMNRLIDVIEADAVAVHLNPLQEILQPEGQTRFSGVLKQISRLVSTLDIPVIVKEVGCGISKTVAQALIDAGVCYIDVAGAGGTSWAGIESFRGADPFLSETFWDWGIPTATSIEMVKSIPGSHIIASGGIRNGMDLAKALALGAELCGAAFPFLRIVTDGGKNALIALLRKWRKELQIVMFLTRCLRIKDLHREGILIKNLDEKEHG
jgi:isopentenyl-diphosphate delta-isomerase